MGNLLGEIGVGRVHHMQQQVCVHGLLQRGLEGVDQAMRQIADEPHRIGQGHRTPQVTEVHLPGGRVQRSKELISGVGAGLDQGIEQGGFPSVGVADQ